MLSWLPLPWRLYKAVFLCAIPKSKRTSHCVLKRAAFDGMTVLESRNSSIHICQGDMFMVCCHGYTHTPHRTRQLPDSKPQHTQAPSCLSGGRGGEGRGELKQGHCKSQAPCQTVLPTHPTASCCHLPSPRGSAGPAHHSTTRPSCPHPWR